MFQLSGFYTITAARLGRSQQEVETPAFVRLDSQDVVLSASQDATVKARLRMFSGFQGFRSRVRV